MYNPLIPKAMFNEIDVQPQVVRTYQFEKGTSGRALSCKVWFPDDPQSLRDIPYIIIQFELNEPLRVPICKNRIHVWAHWSVPSAFVIQETVRFFDTLKQMYSL